METLYAISFYAGLGFAFVVIHESGHYLAGRIGGIPFDQMRLRLMAFPQHVELRDNDDWISPTKSIERYIAIIWKCLRTTPRVYTYVAGGLIAETIFTIVATMTLVSIGQPKAAFLVVFLSLLGNGGWVVADTIAVLRGRTLGDWSGMWHVAKIPTIAFLLAYFVVRAALWIYTKT